MRQAEPLDFDLAASLRLQTDAFRDANPGVDIQLTGADGMLRITAVPDLLSQALDKLLSNAVDFHRPGSTILVCCRTYEKELVLRVRNEGPPLPENVDVFQSMMSGREGRQDEPHLGLGLYLVRLIAEFHGGRVEARNIGDPEGVVIEIWLPREPGPVTK